MLQIWHYSIPSVLLLQDVAMAMYCVPNRHTTVWITDKKCSSLETFVLFVCLGTIFHVVATPSPPMGFRLLHLSTVKLHRTFFAN